jgi:hypothetical protein
MGKAKRKKNMRWVRIKNSEKTEPIVRARPHQQGEAKHALFLQEQVPTRRLASHQQGSKGKAENRRARKKKRKRKEGKERKEKKRKKPQTKGLI